MADNNPDDKQHRCCCNSMHVERGAYIIGIVGMVLSGLGVVGAAVELKWDHAIGSILSLVLYASIIYAQKKQNPSLYWPFLIVNGIGIVLVAIYIIMSAVLLALSMAIPENSLSEETLDGATQDQVIAATRLGIVMVMAMFSAFLIFAAWFQYVVYRAYEYMKMTQMNLHTTNKA
ncbi:hypothetical protein DdX_15536 [Ditylenchus destructor]|uniref:Uncharacterized protein n=1 Tax=Ditylenchus destructor TaxID=166010 RepID=A0AAD4MPC4_9BILA|nr:hypothetical protein DdX_15536 [Ditylenchus destructor]